MENWLPIEEFPGYEVSDLGRIRNENTGRLLGIYDNGHGVKQVVMRKDGRNRARAVHKLVAETFLHPEPEGAVPIHLDNDWNNNSADNLEWKPRWLATRRTQQFKRTEPLDYRRVRAIGTGDIYENSLDAAKRLDGLEEMILSAARANGSVSYKGQFWQFVYN